MSEMVKQKQVVSKPSPRELPTHRIRPIEWMRATGMSEGMTYRAIYAGKLRAVQVGRSWFIEASELEEFFKRQAA